MTKPFKISLIGTKNYSDYRKIKDTIYKLKQHYKDVPVKIYGIGTMSDTGRKVRNYSLEWELDYAEYNPSYTGYNMYSAGSEGMYGKPYHASHVHHSMTMLARVCDVMVIFKGNEELGTCEIAYKQAKKLGKKIAVL